MCVQPQSWQKEEYFRELAQSSKRNIIDLDSEDESEMNLMPSRNDEHQEKSGIHRVQCIRAGGLPSVPMTSSAGTGGSTSNGQKPSTDIG
ncbi:hypothetical protein TNCV_5136701 [Trichonephila clavipes]|nr:hypothetical protein TNCV_5136701 [Trichonephila clavipes]